MEGGGDASSSRGLCSLIHRLGSCSVLFTAVSFVEKGVDTNCGNASYEAREGCCCVPGAGLNGVEWELGGSRQRQRILSTQSATER